VTDGKTVPFVKDEPFDVTKFRHFTVDVLKVYKVGTLSNIVFFFFTFC